ncbi:MAG: hypothetical protein AAFZ11_00010 [Pseudomonadota bacterium]
MSNISSVAEARDSGFTDSAQERLIDRWIFVGTAVLMIAIVLAGFVPSSLEMLDRVAEGSRGPIPLVLHFHAVFMGSWLLLLLIQAILMATDNGALHKKLGLLAFVLVPAMVITGFILVPEVRGTLYARLETLPPEVAADLRENLLPRLTNIILVQIRAGFLVPFFIGMGLYFRRTSPETHRRLMLFGTAVPLGAAIVRLDFYTVFWPEWPLSTMYPFTLVLIPLLVRDLLAREPLNKAWWIFLGALLVVDLPIWLLWGTETWMKLGPRLIGVA